MVGLSLLFLSGCMAIPLPNPEPEPFPEKVTGTIVPGKTSRKDVLATLGNPRSASTDGKLFLYAEEQITELQIAYVFITGDISLGGPTHYYIISFARNGTVVNTKKVTNISNYCRRDGSCLVTEDDLDVWYAPAAIEASAKKFTPISDKCTIYFMWDNSALNWIGLAPHKVVIDRRKTFQFPEIIVAGNMFFHRTVVAAGIHEFSYLKNPATVKVRQQPQFKFQPPFKFQCHAGDVVFVTTLLKNPPPLGFTSNPENLIFTFTLLDPKKAKRKILRMRMLDPDL